MEQKIQYFIRGNASWEQLPKPTYILPVCHSIPPCSWELSFTMMLCIKSPSKALKLWLSRKEVMINAVISVHLTKPNGLYHVLLLTAFRYSPFIILHGSFFKNYLPWRMQQNGSHSANKINYLGFTDVILGVPHTHIYMPDSNDCGCSPIHKLFKPHWSH